MEKELAVNSLESTDEETSKSLLIDALSQNSIDLLLESMSLDINYSLINSLQKAFSIDSEKYQLLLIAETAFFIEYFKDTYSFGNEANIWPMKSGKIIKIIDFLFLKNFSKIKKIVETQPFLDPCTMNKVLNSIYELIHIYFVFLTDFFKEINYTHNLNYQFDSEICWVFDNPANPIEKVILADPTILIAETESKKKSSTSTTIKNPLKENITYLTLDKIQDFIRKSYCIKDMVQVFKKNCCTPFVLYTLKQMFPDQGLVQDPNLDDLIYVLLGFQFFKKIKLCDFIARI